jgi:integrase
MAQGHIAKRKDKDGKPQDDTWRIYYELPRGTDGKRQQKTKTFHGKEKEAQRELRRILRDVDTGSYVPPNKKTLAEFVGAWLEHVRATRSQKTAHTYGELMNGQILPRLGSTQLSRLGESEIQDFYTLMLTAGRKDGRGGLSKRTVRHLHTVLSTSLKHAVRLKLLERNPCCSVEPPRPQRTEMGVLTEGETRRLLQAANGTAFYLPILLAAGTGMRRGEIFGLRWDGINLDEGTLTISRSLVYTPGRLEFKEPKTASGRRTISLPPALVPALRQYKGEQAQRKLMLGPAYQDNGLVACQPDGAPINPTNFSSRFAVYVRQFGLTVRFHDLRHGHATHMFRQGAAVTTVSRRLGHASPSITLGVYGHTLEGMDEAAARSLDGLFDGKAASG